MPSFSRNLVAVAMSGGVDSSVAAYLLKEQGMEVIGISIKTHESPVQSEGGTCCTAEDLQDARRVCQQLDIPFYPLNFKEEFRSQVIEYFGREYSQGRTPNPCVMCNTHLKFSGMMNEIKKLGAYYLATGHYAQKKRGRDGRYHIHRATDLAKDQSYFLFNLNQEQLEHILFPIGHYTKEEVREIARKQGLKTAEKAESQDICFTAGQGYEEFMKNELPQFQGEPGAFVDQEGQELGEHRGIHAYTVGQRRGLGVATGDKIYVTEIIPEEKKVVLGPATALLKVGATVNDVNWIARDINYDEPVDVKIRYRHAGVQARLKLLNSRNLRVDFEEPQRAVTPGQAAVFYRGDELLGGGWIDKAIENTPS